MRRGSGGTRAGKFPSLDSLSLNRTPAIRGQGCDAVSPQSRRTLCLFLSLVLYQSTAHRHASIVIPPHSHGQRFTALSRSSPVCPRAPSPFAVNAAPRTLEHVHAHKDTGRKPQQARRRAFCCVRGRLTDTKKTITTNDWRGCRHRTAGIASTSIMKSRLKTFVGDGQERREMIGG